MAGANLAAMVRQACEDAQSVSDPHQLNLKRNQYLGKKGTLTLQLRGLRDISADERPQRAADCHQAQKTIQDAFAQAQKRIAAENMERQLQEQAVDVTLPALTVQEGRLHPVTHVMREVTTIFQQMGFSVMQGPEVEDDFHNFTSLNIPADHPAREMHDTFYLNLHDDDGNALLLRTHTSPVQMRALRLHGAPLAIVAPGRTYRRDSDTTHTPMFHQLEGLVVDENVTMADLKGCLHDFCRAFFAWDELPLRMRPSFFPFTSPSAEIDIGCRHTPEGVVLGGDDWMEVLGCGMVHENVLRHGNVDVSRYRGFAFGLGIERLAMLKYGMADLRAFFDGDLAWSQHYGFSPFAL